MFFLDFEYKAFFILEVVVEAAVFIAVTGN